MINDSKHHLLSWMERTILMTVVCVCAYTDQAQLHDRQEREKKEISAALTVFNTVRHEQLMRWNVAVWID